MSTETLLPHLFRTEYRKIVAVLAKRFGFAHLETAEDIASDTFLTAGQSWGIEGLPPNPTAWLYNVAKNKAKNFLHRKTLFETKVFHEVKNNTFLSEEFQIDLSAQNIHDSQLQMIFAICHPSLSTEAQVALALRILCGFGIQEIADAFLTSKEVIHKRLTRAKERLREQGGNIEFVSDDVGERLAPVLTTIYLLFNEGYYSVSQNKTLRKDFCLEAIRLCTILVENATTNKPEVNALLALMCFHMSRFDARMTEKGELILYDEQDTDMWNMDFILKGGYFLHRSAGGTHLSKYHLEAGIAYWNTQKPDTTEKWENILHLYDHLLQLEHSPIAALNRIYALFKTDGHVTAIEEAEKLNLTDNHFYFALLGELYADIDKTTAMRHFQHALSLAKTETDKRVLEKRLNRLTA
jgi:RNA polymerase sigma-70 factor (ECF subfamily)